MQNKDLDEEKLKRAHPCLQKPRTAGEGHLLIIMDECSNEREALQTACWRGLSAAFCWGGSEG